MTKDVEFWQKVLDELVSLYCEIERRSFSIPTFSLAPFGIVFWNFLKFEICLFLDFFLLIPINAVILLRNILPGRWCYRSFSGRYFRLAARWIWSGEVPIVAAVAMRSLTQALLRTHFRSRIELVHRCILIQNDLWKEKERELLSTVEKALFRWPSWKLIQSLFTYGLPILSPLVGMYQLLLPGPPPVWAGLVIVMSLSWAIAFVASGFLIKRGLMLGGNERSAYFPGFLTGRGAYVVEERILSTFGVVKKEFPLGFVLSVILIPVGFLYAVSIYESGLYGFLSGGHVFGKVAYLAQSMPGSLIAVILGSVALARRNRLGRS